jgi:hypothetical protein
MSELLIRPGHNDHLVVADLLAPSVGAVLLPHTRPAISRLVLDAPLAAREPQFREAAQDAGVPLLIDPLTPLLQSEVDPADAWAKLPFAQGPAQSAELLGNPFMQQTLIEQSVQFQVEHGASAIIPPYFYAESPQDPYFDASLTTIAATARYLRHNNITLPLFIILCVQRRAFVGQRVWHAGIDRFASAALDVGPQSLALCVSPMGSGEEKLSTVLSTFTMAQRLKDTGARLVVWRQGFYGPGLVAAGLDGYETGIGLREGTNIASLRNARKPRTPDPDAKRRAASAGVYLAGLGRSVQRPVAKILFEHHALRSQLMCDDRRCCPKGGSSMLEDPRPHAVRARGRQLRHIESMPHTAWRLHDVSKEAYAAALLAAKANEVLAAAGERTRIKTDGYEALAQTADLLGRNQRAVA